MLGTLGSRPRQQVAGLAKMRGGSQKRGSEAKGVFFCGSLIITRDSHRCLGHEMALTADE